MLFQFISVAIWAIDGLVSSLLGGMLILSTLGVWFPLMLPSTAAPIIGASPAFKIHMGLSIVGYGFAFMAALDAFLAVAFEYRNKLNR